MATSLFFLIYSHSLFSTVWWIILLQCGAAGLMLWARLVFGRRSFHPSARPTAGGLVRSGPYAVIRHPIYAAAILFTFAGIASHLSFFSVVCAGLILFGALLRIWSEEHFLREVYPEYCRYAEKTKKIIPFIF
jgi:protein-S-isoprenylcysteine O-methyltransferase Ste14